MDLNLAVLGLASRLAAHATARHGIIAENVAHADTPGYRSRDLEDFARTLETGFRSFETRRTRPGHIAFAAVPGGFEMRAAAAFGAETPNGNDVSLEDQMMRAAETRQAHDLALGVYGKTLDILRSGIGR